MRFKAKKSYGNYKTTTCPFCDRIATTKNKQDLDVCHLHRDRLLEEIKCTCGSWLEQKNGKFGPYFNCINCGNFNYNRAMEIKAITEKKINKPISSQFQEKKTKPQQKEITITSRDVDYFD